MQKNRLRKNSVLFWAPCAVTLLFGIVTAVVYPFVTADFKVYTVLEVVFVAAIPAALSLLSVRADVKLPYAFTVMISLHVILAVDFGTALDFYHLVPCWDLLLHGFFGLWSAVFLYWAIHMCGGKDMNAFGKYVLVFLGVLGLAALWEIFEYVSDLLFGSDAQRVWESMENGVNPVEDTMTDIIVAIAGVVVFYLTVGIYNRMKRNEQRQNKKRNQSK